jgi:diguanylate cyclase (GGDEF)-like protein
MTSNQCGSRPLVPARPIGGSGRGSSHILATWGIAGFIAATCAVLIGLETSNIIDQRFAVLAESRKETANLTSSLIQHAELTFGTADAILIGVVDRLEHESIGPETGERLKAWFIREVRRSTQFVSFAVVDSEGAMIASTYGEKAPTQFSDREYFIYHRTHDDNVLHIGDPIRGRSADGWLIPVTRRINHTDGTFGGVAVAAINPKYFQGIYDRLNLGNNSAVVLASLKGTLLARRPFAETNIGRDMSQSGIFAQLKQAPAGSIEITSSTDGVRRLNSYEQGHTYPLVVAVALDMTELLAPWRQSAMHRLVETSIVVAFILLMGAFIWRGTRTLAANSVKLRETNARFGAALSNMTQGLCLFDADKKLVISNGRFREMYELPHDLVMPGTPLSVLLNYQDQRGVKGDLTVDEHLEQIPSMAHQSVSTADGRVISIRRIQVENGGWLATHEDITERRRAEAEIVHLARHDGLTGLVNRAEFNSKLEEASKRLKRNGGAVTVMMLDLDKFKAVNDTLGHPAGDQLLVEVARRLQSVLRETDVPARLGGDEFAIIQEGGSGQHEGASALALRIINAVSQPFDLSGQAANVGVSIGIAMAPEHGVEPEELLKSADLALYNAKTNGRNDFRIYHATMREMALTQQLAETELRDAIAREEFELHYQPVVDVNTRLISGAEALVRWRHPTKGLIAPDKFIPLAESTGLIVALGGWILRRACADAASWPSPAKIAINISGVQFQKGNLFDVVLCALVETGLGPERLELEITETSLLDNQEAHLATIRQLKNLGISMALDDFGTGYSSVTYLTNFPFDKIKIDRSFTQGVLNRRDCAAVVTSVLALAQGLGLKTTAEGIETEGQFEYMRKAGVDFAQGYLFGRPVPISQFDLNNTTLPKAIVA